MLRQSLRSLALAVVALAFAGCELVMGELPPKRSQPLILPDAMVGGSPSPAPLPVQETKDAGTDSSVADSGVTKPEDAAMSDGAMMTVDAQPPDAAAARCDGGPGMLLYQDRDHDGFGDPMTSALRCEAGPGWSDNNKDCNDEEAEVHPGQTNFYGSGYRSDSNITRTSFDYNCDGSESAAPDQELGPETCQGVLLMLICGHSGFAPNLERAGIPGINAYCGSNIIASCDALLCQPHQMTGEVHYACN